jgi:hypothetical protein
MILSDGKIEVDWFEKFFQTDKKNIGLWLSGGTDSSLILYFLCKFITETENFDRKIYPIIAVQTNNKLSKCFDKTQNIIEEIIKIYPKVYINKLKKVTYSRLENHLARDTKRIKIKMNSNIFIKEYKLDILIQGSTINPSEIVGESYSLRDKLRDVPINVYKEKYPWWNVDKKFIAFQYQKYNLMNIIFPLTESCIEDKKDQPFPCKKCFWCEEKYWAFGSYDGGIQ